MPTLLQTTLLLDDDMRPPAFQFYVDNFVEGTVDMTDAEVGLYVRLLCAQWSRGGLPNDDSDLARFSRGAATFQQDLARVRTKFSLCPDGMLRNERLEEERRKQEHYRGLCAQGGKKGGGNPNFKKGSPNPYFNKGQSKVGLLESKGSLLSADKGQINFPSPTPIYTPLPPNGGNGNGGSGNGEWKPNPTQLRLNALFHRRAATRWDKNEIKAFEALGELAEEDLQLLESYYGEEIPRVKDYRRRDLGTLLHHFAGEVDRARNFKPKTIRPF